MRLLHLWKLCAHVATACIREERQRPALLLLADDAHLGFCLSLSGLPWSLLRVRLLQMCRRPSAELHKEVVRANKAKSLLRFRNSGDCSGKQSKAHRAAPVCFALHSKQSERLVGLLQKANKPKPLLLLYFSRKQTPKKRHSTKKDEFFAKLKVIRP